MKENAKIKNIAVKLTADAERQITSGHPWIFDQSIELEKKTPSAGDLGIVFSRSDNKFMAVGLMDPEQVIRIRLLHTGDPVKVDQDFFRNRLLKSLEKRRPLLEEGIEAFRWIYGENDGFPGLILDVYGEYMVLKLYSSAWAPWLPTIVKALSSVRQPKEIIVRLSRKTAQSNTHSLSDGQCYFNTSFNGPLIFKEYGVAFETDLMKGHKTGFFLDHRQNRRFIQKMAQHKKVLDLFAYTGAFSMHAFAGGASSVTAVDISAPALKVAQKNYKINAFKRPFHTVTGDVFQYLDEQSQKNQQYDLIIVDPPAFAKKRSEKEMAVKAYKRLFLKAMPLLSSGGVILLASCSSRINRKEFDEVIAQCMSDSPNTWQLIKRTGHDLDHPSGISELDYLKSSFLRRFE